MSRHSMIHHLFTAILLWSVFALPVEPLTPVVDAQRGGTRSRDWVQSSAADFRTGQLAWTAITDVEGGELRLSPNAIAGTYTSPVVQADWAFTAIAPRWRAQVPPGASISVELRIYAEGGWSTWLPIQEIEQAAGQDVYYPEVPLLTWDGRQFQYRVTMGTSPIGASPVLEAMTITYIDSTPGPTMAEAAGMAIQDSMAAQGIPQPTMISRAGWGADEDYRYDAYGYLIWPLEYRAVQKIVVHHTATTNDYTDGPYYVRAIYYYHAVTLGWGDIGYNYLVDKFGNVYEGRYGGPDIVAGHSYGHNYGSMGVSVIGTHESVTPTPASLASLRDLTAWEANRSYIHPLESSFFVDTVAPNIAGHRDYNATTCPGDALYGELPGVRQGSWDRIVAQEDQYHVDWEAWEALPQTVCANSTYSLDIAVRNTGWYTYVHAGPKHSVRIGYHWYDDNGERIVQPEEDDHRGGLPYDVTFGHIYTFTPALVTTPITPGSYTLEWDMVHEGISWFHEANPASPVLTMTFVVTNCVSLVSADQSALENAGTVTVPLQLSVVSDVAVRVPFTLSGTATEGALEDYGATSSPVTIPPGITRTHILFALNDDSLDEHDETVVVTLGQPEHAIPGATAVHTVTIVDDDPPPTVGFVSARQSGSETAGTMTITLGLDAQSGLTVTVPFALSGTATEGVPGDYVASSPVTIPAGITETHILLTLDDDSLDEHDETVIVTLGTPVNATLATTTAHTATILDDDPQPTVGLIAAGQSAPESAGTLTVTLELDAASGLTVIVPFALSGTATEGALEDYTATPSPATIPAGQTSAQILIAVQDDSLDEHDETVVITLGTPANAALGATTVHTATIVDDDDPPAVSFVLSHQSALETVDMMTVALQLDAASGLEVTVPFTLSGTATEGALEDYTITPSPLPIPPGEMGAEILIAVNSDGLDEEDETVVLSLGTPANATLGATAVHTATILDPLRVSGYVFDVYGQPVSGGQVAVQGGLTITANASGAYALYLPPLGTYTITASAQGHAPSLPATGIDGTQDNVTYAFVLAPSLFVNAFENGQLEDGLDNLRRGGISASPPAPTATAHTGVGAAEMSVATPGARTWLSQSVTLPAEQISPTLSFLYRVPTGGDKSRFRVTLAATSTLTYTIPLTVSGWAHYAAPLPPEMNGNVDVTFELMQSTAVTPTTVLVDEIVVGYRREPYKVFLPLVIRNAQPEWWPRPSTDPD
jgi:hypothetical protein